jgi:hypothetical protein
MDATLWQRRYTLLFTLGVSYCYHRRRQRFFDLVDKCTKAATVLAGASLIGALVQGYAPWLGGLISALGLLSLIFAYSDRKQAHKELGEAFMLLQAQVVAAGPTMFTESQLAGWEADLDRLNAKEPPTLRALVTLCQNEQAIATGHPQDVRPLPLHQRLLASWVSFSAT